MRASTPTGWPHGCSTGKLTATTRQTRRCERRSSNPRPSAWKAEERDTTRDGAGAEAPRWSAFWAEGIPSDPATS